MLKEEGQLPTGRLTLLLVFSLSEKTKLPDFGISTYLTN